jgi:branched-chain amino acid transport system permease protein
MVSLAQMTVAGIAGYCVAILGTSSAPTISLGWPWWVALPFALAICVALRRADRLAVGAHRGHLHDHDHARDRRRVLLPGAAELHVFNGFQGCSEVVPPTCLGIDWRDPLPFYFLAVLRARRLLLVRSSCARRSASRCRASATTRGA